MRSRIVQGTIELRVVDSAERELAVVEIRKVEGLEGDANHVLFE